MKNYFDLLEQFIAFKSVSTDPVFQDQMIACADRLLEQLKKHWFEAQRLDGFGNPLVFAEYVVDQSLPTYLVYGHYDVQPAEQEDGWSSDPFMLKKDDERIYARGVVDNKGQHLIHLATIFDLIEKKQLGVNIKVLIEGDEETWSPHIVDFFKQHSELLKCDGVVISDGEIIGHKTPTMTQSFRGGANLTLTVKTADTDLHSGIYGNVLPSATQSLVDLCAKFYDNKGLIAIPGRYDDVAPIDATTKQNNLKVPFNKAELFAATWTKAIVAPQGYDPVTANWLLPTIQISWLQWWYTGNGYKNIIPAQATVKINFRFAPWQNAERMIEQFEMRVKEELPAYCSYTITTSDPYDAIALNIDSKFVEKCRDILSKVYETPVIMRHCGAAVPISGLFQEYVGCPVAAVDLGNEDCNMHGINENFRLENIEKGLRFSEMIFRTS